MLHQLKDKRLWKNLDLNSQVYQGASMTIIFNKLVENKKEKV